MSKPRNVSAIATVTVTLEVRLGAWGSDCTMAQIHRQASEGARMCAQSMIGSRQDLRVVSVGKVVVRAVMDEEQGGE